MKNKQINKIIEDNKNDFNDSDELIDFINNYNYNDDKTIDELEDCLSEYTDGKCPIYHHYIVKEWQENRDCHEMTIEVFGKYTPDKTIYEMMTSDLYFFYEKIIREDLDQLSILIDKEETN